MVVEFQEAGLRRLYEDEDAPTLGLATNVVKAFRKVVGVVVAATDERDLYALKSLHYEKLKGTRSTQRSVRLNDQWRLIVQRVKTGAETKIVILGLPIDYH